MARAALRDAALLDQCAMGLTQRTEHKFLLQKFLFRMQDMHRRSELYLVVLITLRCAVCAADG